MASPTIAELVLTKFSWNITLRIILLLILVIGVVVSFEKGFYLTTVFAGLLLVFAVSNLIAYVNQTNRDLASFLASVQYDDFTTTAAGHQRGASFGELHQSLKLINRKFQDVRAEKEANHQFLQTIVEHINIGLLCTNEAQEVILMNKALQQLLHKSYLVKLESLQQVDPSLWQTVKALTPGERSLYKLNTDNRLTQIAIQAIDLIMQGERLRLYTFQNIQTELEEQELQAWQKLIRILTHEIMNSVAPIASLSSTIRDVIALNDQQLDEGMMARVKSSVEVIQKRSEGLLDFTETYRSLTRLPQPKFQTVEAGKLTRQLTTLFQPSAAERRIAFEVYLPPNPVHFQADPGLLEQVLINLIRNAMEAVAEREHPTVELHVARNPAGRVVIQVADNGIGIPTEMLEQIFVPFFTTKDEGSGIGLSLSRQIMRMHKGNIEVQSVENKGTVVTLTL